MKINMKYNIRNKHSIYKFIWKKSATHNTLYYWEQIVEHLAEMDDIFYIWV